MKELSDHIKQAITCGPSPRIREWQTLPTDDLTDGERVLRFSADYLVFPEGKMIGKPLILDEFQQVFILAVYDSPQHTRKAILSMARRGGKTLIMAVICLAHIIGPMAKQNENVRSAAMTRDQAALLWRLMNLICSMSKDLSGLWRSVPSSKRLIGISKNVEYQALSRDAKSGHGQAFKVLVVDECGQIDAPSDDFLDMLFSSMGTFEDSRVFLISTQAPSSSAFFSVELDNAELNQPEDVVCHLYTAPSDDLLDEKNWYAANPSLYGGYRSLTDIKTSCSEAIKLPAKQNGVLNLLMNRRVSLQNVWLAPAVWKANNKDPDWDVFRENGVSVGLDLSQKNDLTVACMAAMDDDGIVHVHPFAFTPLDGIEDRSRRDRVSYDVWANTDVLYAVPGPTIDYDWVATFLRVNIIEQGIAINSIEFDAWKMPEFKAALIRNGVELPDEQYHEIRQGYKTMTVILDSVETALLQNKIRHGAHPILNLGASSAVSVSDPTGARKLDKTKASQKIDGIIAMIQACHILLARTEIDLGEDLSWMIG